MAGTADNRLPNDQPLYYGRHVFMCNNTRPAGHPRRCCSNHGSEQMRNYMKLRAKEMGFDDTRVNAAGCLDRCELGPTMVIYPEGVWYTYKTREDIDEILSTHLAKNGRVERLMLTAEQTEPR